LAHSLWPAVLLAAKWSYLCYDHKMTSGPGNALCVIASFGNDTSCDSVVTHSRQYRTDVTNKPCTVGGTDIL